MTKIKLTNGTVIDASNIEVVNGTLKITTSEHTVEELAEMFVNFENTNYITLMTESGTPCGYKTGFTSFAGITYDAEGNKTVELFQPKNVTEAKIASAAAVANMVNEKMMASESDITTMRLALDETTAKANNVETNIAIANEKVSSIETDITDIQLALVEIYESTVGGNE